MKIDTWMVEGCEIFMNENEISMEEMNGNQTFETKPSLYSKIDVSLELILKQLHEQIIHWKPHNTIF